MVEWFDSTSNGNLSYAFEKLHIIPETYDMKHNLLGQSKLIMLLKIIYWHSGWKEIGI